MARLYEALERAEKEVDGLAIVPKAPRERQEEAPSKIREKLIPAYQKVLQSVEGDCRTVCLVGLTKGDAVTALLREFALLIAQDGGKRVLLLETPEGRGAFFRYFDVHCDATLHDAISGKCELDSVVHATARSGLSLCRMAGPNGSARAVLSHREFSTAYESLCGDFDFILWGAMANTDPTEAATLACKADGAVMVIESGKTRWQVAQRLRAEIESLGGQVLGAILNNRRHYIPAFVYRWL